LEYERGSTAFKGGNKPTVRRTKWSRMNGGISLEVANKKDITLKRGGDRGEKKKPLDWRGKAKDLAARTFASHQTAGNEYGNKP